MGGTDLKLESEVQSLTYERDFVKSAMKTSEGCQKIVEFVNSDEGKDPLVQQGDNPYLQAPASGGGCGCVIS